MKNVYFSKRLTWSSINVIKVDKLHRNKLVTESTEPSRSSLTDEG